MIGRPDDRDHMADYRQFWAGLVETGGQLDLDKVARELHDYRHVIGQVPLVYDHITGGRLTKPNYFADDVIGAAIEYEQKGTDDAVAEELRAQAADLTIDFPAAATVLLARAEELDPGGELSVFAPSNEPDAASWTPGDPVYPARAGGTA